MSHGPHSRFNCFTVLHRWLFGFYYRKIFYFSTAECRMLSLWSNTWNNLGISPKLILVIRSSLTLMIWVDLCCPGICLLSHMRRFLWAGVKWRNINVSLILLTIVTYQLFLQSTLMLEYFPNFNFFFYCDWANSYIFKYLPKNHDHSVGFCRTISVRIILKI